MRAWQRGLIKNFSGGGFDSCWHERREIHNFCQNFSMRPKT